MKTIQEILPLIEQPSRYLGSETNTVKKDRALVKLSFALVFPDMYEIGTSHFGLQILYNILNSHKDIAAERIFSPGTDMEAYLRSSHIPIASLESRQPLGKFDIIGFSLLYELNFTNILTILDLAGIPFFASQRDNSHPLVIAGGPCMCNPEPVADFFDAIVIGDGETVIMEMARSWLTWKENQDQDKENLLKIWSGIQGVYIPAFFEPQKSSFSNTDGFQTVLPKRQDYTKVTRTIVSDLDTASFPKSPVIPYGRPVHDRLCLEISRGCTRGCRFCQAGMIYRPVRERSPDTILKLSQESMLTTGYEDISLLSLSTGDYGCITWLMERLMARCESEHTAVSFPSLRAGTLTPELMNLIKKVRKTGFTIAPEAGSQRLRNVINKNIEEKEISDTVRHAFNLGWQVIKLYFMIGLPTETDGDLKSLVELVKSLRTIKGEKGRKGKIHVSVGTFIPKSHTPFQWASQVSLTESKEKIRMVQNSLRMPGISFKWHNPEVSMLEGLWARGDRSLSGLLVTAYEKGCKFDGWSDNFQYRLWQEAFAEQGTDIDFFTTRTRNMAESLPWDHIDTRVSKEFLKEEWEKAVKCEQTTDCRDGDCKGCGVCDFESTEPRIYNPEDLRGFQNPAGLELGIQQQPPIFKKMKVSFSKTGQAKYFGHLELVKIFLRAIKRAGIPVKFSEGFHPMPKVSFEDPLPIGMESLNESFFVSVSGNIEPRAIVEGLNRQLPDGLAVHECQHVSGKAAHEMSESKTYLVKIKNGLIFDESELENFIKRPELIITRTKRKGKTKSTDLKQAVLKIEMPSPDRLQMILKSTVRPFEAIKEIFSLHEEQLKQADIIKL
ncbi:MAG: TIGR03960 family B12-binding radical SAM protein [Desulfobacterales bacterium]|nr:TIGR03960 family B12-binding radical SAM protein [Desulfobacterales bacterium]